jgi:hypothetical protein
MKTKVLTLAIALNVFAVTPMWAQQKSPDPNLLAQLEKRLAESDTKAKGLTGGPKSLWLLREAKIEKIIDRLKAGQAVDPKEIDVILKGQVN